jgi:hypothetical protein
MPGGPHVFHLTNVISRIFVFYYKDGRNKNDRQIWESELFLLIEFPYKGGPKDGENKSVRQICETEIFLFEEHKSITTPDAISAHAKLVEKPFRNLFLSDG